MVNVLLSCNFYEANASLTKRECMIAELRINEVAFTEMILHLRSCPIKLINAK